MKGKMVMKKIKENREDGEELSLGIRKKELVFSLEDILKSVAILVAASCLGCIFQKVGLAEANIITVYVLAVLIISVVTVHRVIHPHGQIQALCVGKGLRRRSGMLIVFQRPQRDLPFSGIVFHTAFLTHREKYRLSERFSIGWIDDDIAV